MGNHSSLTAANEETGGDPNSLENFITARLSRTHAIVVQQASQLLREKANLSLVQWRIIALLKAFGPSTSVDLIEYSKMDKGLLSRNVKQLVADGVVTSELDRDDHRQHILSLSATGEDIHQRTEPFMQARRIHLLEGISEQERELFYSVLERLDTNAKRHEFP